MKIVTNRVSKLQGYNVKTVKRCVAATLLTLITFLTPPLQAQIGTYVTPRLTTIYTNTITAAVTSPMVTGTNFLNYSGFHQPAFVLTITATNTLQAPNGASASTNGALTLFFDQVIGPGSGYTNSLLGTNVAITTTQPLQWTVLLGGNTNYPTQTYTNLVTITNLGASFADSIPAWRLTKITTVVTNPSGFNIQLDQSIAP